MPREEIYTIAKLASYGRDLAERFPWRDNHGDVEQIQDIFKDILKQVEELKKLA